MDIRTQVLTYAHDNQRRFQTELEDLVRIPSVSTDVERQAEMQRTAEWLANKLHSIGMQQVKIFPTAKHPVVFASYQESSSLPTVLIYGHYDVQPADPLELWNSDPFTPVQDGDNLYGRGASDMKGQVIASIAAVESVLKTGSLPVNVKFMIEGEEEIGSPNLSKFLTEHKDLLASDVALNPDTGMISADQPTIIYALRGLAYFEIRFYGPDHDLHSGVFGGVIRNPATVLCEVIAKMHDEQGRVTLPGFYDSIRPLSSQERSELARLPLSDQYYMDQTGSTGVWGEEGYSSLERVGGRPTLDVNGLLSGFTGEGSKTVLPSWSMAKISMRLVPDQDPNQVQKQLEVFLEKNVPDSIHWKIFPQHGGFPSISDTNHPATIALSKALETVWGTRPLYKREGGSVPVVADMQKILGIDSALTGFGLPDDNIHAPNEKLHLPTWCRGIDALIHFLFNYGEV